MMRSGTFENGAEGKIKGAAHWARVLRSAHRFFAWAARYGYGPIAAHGFFWIAHCRWRIDAHVFMGNQTAMTMARDNDFEPKLGRIRAKPGRAERRYLQNVLKGIARAGGRAAKSKRHFSGKHHGRGGSAASVLSPRASAFRARRVIVKARIVQLKGKLDGARAHLRYIQRDGVTREGMPGELYSASSDYANGKSFLDRADGDRHQFRFIVSADDGAQYNDLKDVTRRLMQQMETDLGTKLEWVAVDHFNTGHPHSHIILRGKTDRGDDLVIARDYLIQGLRERTSEIVTLDLGPRTDVEIQTAMRAEVEQERFTGLDRTLVQRADPDHLVAISDTGAGAFRQSLLVGRLQKLRKLSMAEEVQPGHWRLDGELEIRLRELGERHDIIKTMHRELTRLRRMPQSPEIAVFNPAEGQGLVGRVMARGLSDELRDRHYLIVDGVDGRSHYVDIGASSESYPEGNIVAVEPRRTEIRTVDRTIAEIAAAHDGRYSVDIHLKHDPTARQIFAETHARRLEAMRRLGNLVDREPNGTWIIAPDHLDRAKAFEQAQSRRAPVVIETLSPAALEAQVNGEGATWLDRELIATNPRPLRDAGFGKEVREALIRRQQWLIEQELAERDQDQIVYSTNLLKVLRTRELARAGAQLSEELGLAYLEAKPGTRVEGIYRQRIDLVSGRFAVVTRGRDFTLVPWREVLERSRGTPVSGIAREEGISWALGRRRTGPEIS